MEKPEEKLFALLSRGLEFAVRQQLRVRIEVMQKDLNYLNEKKHPNLLNIFKSGWTMDRLQLLFCLASFYQAIVGPISSSSRSATRSGLSNSVPIRYGTSQVFDRAWVSSVREMQRAFDNLVFELNINPKWLQASRTEEMLFRMSLGLKSEE